MLRCLSQVLGRVLLPGAAMLDVCLAAVGSSTIRTGGERDDAAPGLRGVSIAAPLVLPHATPPGAGASSAGPPTMACDIVLRGPMTGSVTLRSQADGTRSASHVHLRTTGSSSTTTVGPSDAHVSHPAREGRASLAPAPRHAVLLSAGRAPGAALTLATAHRRAGQCALGGLACSAPSSAAHAVHAAALDSTLHLLGGLTAHDAEAAPHVPVGVGAVVLAVLGPGLGRDPCGGPAERSLSWAAAQRLEPTSDGHTPNNTAAHFHLHGSSTRCHVASAMFRPMGAGRGHESVGGAASAASGRMGIAPDEPQSGSADGVLNTRDDTFYTWSHHAAVPHHHQAAIGRSVPVQTSHGVSLHVQADGQPTSRFTIHGREQAATVTALQVLQALPVRRMLALRVCGAAAPLSAGWHPSPLRSSRGPPDIPQPSEASGAKAHTLGKLCHVFAAEGGSRLVPVTETWDSAVAAGVHRPSSAAHAHQPSTGGMPPAPPSPSGLRSTHVCASTQFCNLILPSALPALPPVPAHEELGEGTARAWPLCCGLSGFQVGGIHCACCSLGATCLSSAGLNPCISGGTGSLGLLLLGWWWSQTPAPSVATLLGRSGRLTNRALVTPSTAASPSAVRVMSCDAGSRAAAASCLEATLWTAYVHATGVLEDGVLAHQNAGTARRAAAPKCAALATAARWLTTARPRHVLLFSSAASLIGNAGQGSYAAANAMLDGAAKAARQRGLPWRSIQWGPWALPASDGGGGTGMASDAVQRRLAARGLPAILPRQGLTLLSTLLSSLALGPAWPCGVGAAASNAVVAALPLVRWSRLLPRALLEHTGLSSAVGGNRPTHTSEFRPGTERRDRDMETHDEVVRIIQDVVATAAGLAIGVQEGFMAAGMDSLALVELHAELSRRLGVSVPPTASFDHPDPADLAGFLIDLCRQEEEAADVGLVGPDGTPPPRDAGWLSYGAPGGESHAGDSHHIRVHIAERLASIAQSTIGSNISAHVPLMEVRPT